MGRSSTSNGTFAHRTWTVWPPMSLHCDERSRNTWPERSQGELPSRYAPAQEGNEIVWCGPRKHVAPRRSSRFRKEGPAMTSTHEPIGVLEAILRFTQNRKPKLVRLKLRRMAADPFRF